MNPVWLKHLAVASVFTMLGCLWLWLVWLEPYRFGVWIAAILTLIAAPALPGMIRGKRYTYKWASLMATGYMGFALVEAYSVAEARTLALITLSAATLWFIACMMYSSAIGQQEAAAAAAKDKPDQTQ